MYSAMVPWHLCTYSSIGYSPTASMASYYGGHYQPNSPTRQFIFPVIIQAIRWWNTSCNFNIVPVIIQLLLWYNSTVCTTDLYIIALALTVSLIFSRTFDTMHHRLLQSKFSSWCGTCHYHTHKRGINFLTFPYGNRLYLNKHMDGIIWIYFFFIHDLPGIIISLQYVPPLFISISIIFIVGTIHCLLSVQFFLLVILLYL